MRRLLQICCPLTVAVFLIVSIDYTFAIDCLDNVDDELQRYSSLNTEFENKVKELTPSPEMEEKIRKSLESDDIGKQISQSKYCLESLGFNGYNSSNNDNTINFVMEIALTAGSIFFSIILAFRLRNHYTKKTAKHAIENELNRIENTLNRPIEDTLGISPIKYVPYMITTTAFDSIVSTGAFTYFSDHLQSALDVFYYHVQQHNEELDTLNELIIGVHINKGSPTIARFIQITVDHFVYTENEMLTKLLPEARKYL